MRNAAATIAEQLAALSRQRVREPWEVIVVDNGCSDDTMTIVDQWRPHLPQLRVVSAPDRAGTSYARNAGLATARGTIVAFCDADDVVADGWAQALYDSCADADLAGGMLEVERLNDAATVYWRGGSPTATGLPIAHRYLPSAVSANLAIRRETLQRLGGFDERFNICSEDVDLSWRVREAGGRLTFAGGAVVHYRFRPDLRTNLRQQLNYGHAEAKLYRKFRPRLRRAPGREAAATYAYLIGRVDHLFRGRALRGRWLCVLAYRFGRLRGSYEQRVLWW